jgi:aminopeptidase C
MLDDWFDKYVQVVVIHRKYLPSEILAQFKTPSTMLPPWDPMVKTLTME